MDRCSSNDSGLGNSLGLFAVSNTGLNSSNEPETGAETGNSTSSEGEPTANKEILPPPPPAPARKRFPRLGVSSYFIGAPGSSSTTSSTDRDGVKSDESSESESTDAMGEVPRTSTPQQSPSKPDVESLPVPTESRIQCDDQLPDFLNPCLPQGQPLPTVEDLLYPGIAREKQRDNRVLKNSKKMFESVKTKTTAGLSKMKSSISELVKSERCEAELEKEIFEKICTKLARESTGDDFSIHMIEEASLQRLTAVAPAHPILPTDANRQRQFPPVGTNVVESPDASLTMSPLLVPKTVPGGSKRVRRSRRGATDTVVKKDMKNQSRRRKAITDVRKRVQDAHIKEQQLIEMSKGPGAPAEGPVPFHHRVPRCYNGRKLVYTRQGQVPQYRNGQLDWNYLWFFSDSSTTTNSTTDQTVGERTQLNITSESGENIRSGQTDSDSETPASPDSQPSPLKDDNGRKVSQKSKSHRVRSPAAGLSSPAGHRVRMITPPPSTPNSIMRQAKKKRIRRLAPPQDDNVQLLGMI